jgi:hypothetical protein
METPMISKIRAISDIERVLNDVNKQIKEGKDKSFTIGYLISALDNTKKYILPKDISIYKRMYKAYLAENNLIDDSKDITNEEAYTFLHQQAPQDIYRLALDQVY